MECPVTTKYGTSPRRYVWTLYHQISGAGEYLNRQSTEVRSNILYTKTTRTVSMFSHTGHHQGPSTIIVYGGQRGALND